jgi:hypothetical protein
MALKRISLDNEDTILDPGGHAHIGVGPTCPVTADFIRVFGLTPLSAIAVLSALIRLFLARGRREYIPSSGYIG